MQYEPTKEEIDKVTAEIRAEWDEITERRRNCYPITEVNIHTIKVHRRKLLNFFEADEE